MCVLFSHFWDTCFFTLLSISLTLCLLLEGSKIIIDSQLYLPTYKICKNKVRCIVVHLAGFSLKSGRWCSTILRIFLWCGIKKCNKPQNFLDLLTSTTLLCRSGENPAWASSKHNLLQVKPTILRSHWVGTTHCANTLRYMWVYTMRHRLSLAEVSCMVLCHVILRLRALNF